MEHSMEHSMEPLLDFHSNLPEMLAVDLEQSSDIFRSRQLTAGAPAPGLADDGGKRQCSIPHSSSYVIPKLPSKPDGGLANPVSLQTIHHKYSDIFAPLDFNAPKRGSISSSDDSADLEPPSISTRGDSVLTVDTWLDSEKHPPPTYLHITPTSDEYTAQISWIDLEADDTSPTIQRRRSSMTDFPKFTEQPWDTNETGMRTMSLRSRMIDEPETPITPVNKRPHGYPVEIPKRRSSLRHQQSARDLSWGETDHDAPHFTSPAPPYDELPSTSEHNAGTSFLEDEADYNFRESTDRPSLNGDRGLVIASDKVNFDEWLESDLAHLAREDQPLPRRLGPGVQERINSYVTNFPEPLLLCNSLLIEDIRNLSQGVRYDTETPKSKYQTTPGQQSNNQPQAKLRMWKWLNPSTNTVEKQEQPDPLSTSNKQPWAVIRKVFPRESGGLCEALYAYLLVYNYITSLSVRSIPLPIDQPRSITPRTAQRPSTGNSVGYADFDDEEMYMSTLPQPALPKRDKPKWPELLGIEREQGVTSAPSSSTRPPSRDSGRGTPTYHLNSLSRPETPTTSRAGTAPRGPDQNKQLMALRRGLAMCCARLVVTLQRTDPNSTEHKPDSECMVNPSFMRSLCENVRSTEEGRGRC
ncbi:hypothetical protein F4825DRAFT_186047 [Nemania diffusa]|nr:hypothetical protein F4825DRAFT_186047 [Nemania diffusa]